MTEAETRDLLCDCDGVGGLDPGLPAGAGRWRPVAGPVTGELQGWQFQIEVVEGGLQVSARTSGGGDPAVWFVRG